MEEAWKVVNEFILPFFEFIKKVINAFLKLIGQPTIASL